MQLRIKAHRPSRREEQHPPRVPRRLRLDLIKANPHSAPCDGDGKYQPFLGRVERHAGLQSEDTRSLLGHVDVDHHPLEDGVGLVEFDLRGTETSKLVVRLDLEGGRAAPAAAPKGWLTAYLLDGAPEESLERLIVVVLVDSGVDGRGWLERGDIGDGGRCLLHAVDPNETMNRSRGGVRLLRLFGLEIVVCRHGDLKSSTRVSQGKVQG